MGGYRWLQVVTGDSKEEMMIFCVTQTDKHTLHHDIYIIIISAILVASPPPPGSPASSPPSQASWLPSPPRPCKEAAQWCALVSPRQEDLTLHQGCTAAGDKDGHDDTRGGEDDGHGYDDRGGDGDVADDDDDDGDVV